MEETLYKYLKAIRMKKLKLKMENYRVPSNKIAKLRGAEIVILAVLDDLKPECLWEELKL